MENQQKRLSEDFPHEFSPGPSKDSSQELVTREKRRDKLRNFYYAYMSRKRSRGAIIIDQSGDTMTSRTTSEPKRESHLTSDDESDPSSDDSSSESSTNEDLETRYEVLRRESICRRSSRVLREDWVTVQRGIEDMDCLEEEPECDYGMNNFSEIFDSWLKIQLVQCDISDASFLRPNLAKESFFKENFDSFKGLFPRNIMKMET